MRILKILTILCMTGQIGLMIYFFNINNRPLFWVNSAGFFLNGIIIISNERR